MSTYQPVPQQVYPMQERITTVRQGKGDEGRGREGRGGGCMRGGAQRVQDFEKGVLKDQVSVRGSAKRRTYLS